MEAALAAVILTGPISQPVADAAVIPASQAAFAECVSDRESDGDYRARNPRSSAAGRWQFLDSQWRRGLAFMIAARLRDHGLDPGNARRIRVALQATHIAAWPAPLQDAGFVAVLNARGPWTGWRHWHHVGSRCNRLAASR